MNLLRYKTIMELAIEYIHCRSGDGTEVLNAMEQGISEIEQEMSMVDMDAEAKATARKLQSDRRDLWGKITVAVAENPNLGRVSMEDWADFALEAFDARVKDGRL